MMARSTYSNRRPNTLTQDCISQRPQTLLQRAAGPYIWVTSGNNTREHNESALPRTADLRADVAEVALGHVWTAPDWQGLSSRLQHWSEQPCVRPVCAVYMTAGHNALRGSGPGQNLAFDDAVALVGCSDRQIDRLCITCCLPLPTVTSRRMSDAISSHHFTP